MLRVNLSTWLGSKVRVLLHKEHPKGPQECNDLFSRFEQLTSILEKLAEATDPTMDRQGHNGPSQGLVSKHIENLKIGY